MKSNPVVWFEIYVENMARAKAFYEATLDVKPGRKPWESANRETGSQMT